MSRHLSRARRRDANEAEIVRALEAVGASVQLLDGAAGLPDLLVGLFRQTYLLEVKLPLGPRGGASEHQTLNEAQTKWHEEFWKGAEPRVVRTVHEALRAVGAISRVITPNSCKHRLCGHTTEQHG